jgi:hypothetical protein
MGTSLLAPLAFLVANATFTVIVSFKRLVTESEEVPKNWTKEPAEYCLVPLAKSMVKAAQPEPQSRPVTPVVVWVNAGSTESPQVPHLFSLYGSVASAVLKVVSSW